MSNKATSRMQTSKKRKKRKLAENAMSSGIGLLGSLLPMAASWLVRFRLTKRSALS